MADRSRISPLLDKCLMRVCASAGYQSAERDIKALMGLEVGHSSLHRYVQKQELEMPAILDTILQGRGCANESSSNYHYWTNIALQPIAVGSGDVESAVKQMGMRVKLSGARWAPANVNQILSLRCAYLNGVFDIA